MTIAICKPQQSLKGALEHALLHISLHSPVVLALSPLLYWSAWFFHDLLWPLQFHYPTSYGLTGSTFVVPLKSSLVSLQTASVHSESVQEREFFLASMHIVLCEIAEIEGADELHVCN